MADFLTTPIFLSNLQTSKSFNVAGLAFWVFDYCITFETEVHWVCGRKWDLTRFVFTASRYLPLIGALMTVSAALQTDRSGSCMAFNDLSDIIHMLGIIASEGLLILRTYAFWQGNKKLLTGVLLYGVVSLIIAVVLPRQIHDKFHDSNPRGCIFAGDTTNAIQYAFLIVFEIVLLFLTALKRYKCYEYVGDGIVIATLFRDNVMYMGAIISISLANIIVIVTVPFGAINSLDTLQLVLHSVLASRILFNLRESGSILPDGLPLSNSSSLRKK